MIYQKHCPGCFENKSGLPVCPVCGYDESAARSPLYLPHGLVLGGQYRVGRVLGQPGGFGITYVGWDVYLQQRVAIKEYLPRTIAARAPDSFQVQPHGDSERKSFEAGQEQFLREARIVARFDHPNIVRVRNFFNANGTAYLVMDYYEGMSLGDYLGGVRSRIDAEVAVGLMLPVLDGLDYVHQRGVVHRDLKPHNIYLAAVGRPIVLDFGAARQAVGDLAPTLSLMLTEGYAPVEQYQRKAAQGPYTDVYGVAATLYRMIAGIAPPMALDRVGRDPLDAGGWAKLPELLRPTMRKALAARPEERFQSASEFSVALGAYLAQTPNGLSSPTPLELADDQRMPSRPASSPTPGTSGTSSANGSARSHQPMPPPLRPRGTLRGTLVKLLLLCAAAWVMQRLFGESLSAIDFSQLSARLTLPLPHLISIHAGEFVAGEPPTTQTFSVGAFRIARDEVTQAQFRAFVHRTGYHNANWIMHPCETDGSHAPHWDEPGFEVTGDEPVTCVSLRDAQAYASWLSRETGDSWRLPTEAEWEYAARAGTRGRTWWGPLRLPAAAVCAGCEVGLVEHPLPARGRVPNPWGLLDVAGNVAELTCSAYAPLGETARRCTASGDSVVLKGGSWADPIEKLALGSRSAWPLDRRTTWVGFRVAADETR